MASIYIIVRQSCKHGGGAKRLAVALSAATLTTFAAASLAQGGKACLSGTLYLTFDTGSMSQADLIANVLKKHEIKATFFLASEKTVKGDFSLDPAWGGYWKSLASQGHVFGSHTFDHVYFRGASKPDQLAAKPQFGSNAGKPLIWSNQQLCTELNKVKSRFSDFVGASASQVFLPIWRAPGGKAPAEVMAAASQCGYKHVHWAKAGFLGDELSSETHPNTKLLSAALADLKDGDITVAHLGIWSRKDPWAPAVLEPLIVGLKQKGFCFATLRDHPDYR
jgi:peptidoglycan/xylan/chitin deacetylase (PgdA/CDA1 family)